MTGCIRRSPTPSAVQAVIQLGHILRLAVAAEGVESGEQLAFLRRPSCDEGQGFYFSKPLHPADFEELLRMDGADERWEASAQPA
jgi:EAL domain-containing protein (putative c-di-GMP-specific phosphodiesterase class I)